MSTSNQASARTSAEPLLPAALLAKLERLSLLSRRPMRGQVLGARRSVRHGASVEFSDFRDYTAGDDLRYVDWKAYGRLEKLFVKLFREEDDLSLHLLLDASDSMAFGAPVTKLRFGQQMCAALGAIALMEFDRCSVATVSNGRTGRAPTLRGRASVGTLFARLGRVQSAGQALIANALSGYAQTRTAPGLLVAVSDFYDHGLTRAMLARAGRQLDIILVHIVAPEEVDPEASFDTASGDVRLLDSETQEYVELTVTPALLEQYRQEFQRFCDDLETTARAGGAGYVRVTTDTPLEDVVLGALRRKRVVG